MKRLLYITMMLLFAIISSADAQVETTTKTHLERRLGFGAQFGVISSTVGGSYFGMAFSADYQLARNFSLAEIISFIPSGDLTQINANTVARFNIPLEYVSVIPYMGIGFTYGSYETDIANENSFAFSFPIGASVNIPLAAQIEGALRLQYTLTNLDYGVLGTDKDYVEFMVGFRYLP
jgi:hypothetical protein